MAQETDNRILQDAIKMVTLNSQIRSQYIDRIIIDLKTNGVVVDLEEADYRSFLDTMSPTDIVFARYGMFDNPSPKLSEYMSLIGANSKAKKSPEPKPKVVTPPPKKELTFLSSENLSLFGLTKKDPIFKLIFKFVNKKGSEFFSTLTEKYSDKELINIIVFLAYQEMNVEEVKNNIEDSLDYIHSLGNYDLTEYYLFLNQLNQNNLQEIFCTLPSLKRYETFINIINNYFQPSVNDQSTYVEPDAQLAPDNQVYTQQQAPASFTVPEDDFRVDDSSYYSDVQGIPTYDNQPVASVYQDQNAPLEIFTNNVPGFENFLMQQYHQRMGGIWKRLNDAIDTNVTMQLDPAISVEERRLARKRYMLLSSQASNMDYELRGLIYNMRNTEFYQHLLHQFISHNATEVFNQGDVTYRTSTPGIVGRVREFSVNQLNKRLDRIRKKETNLLPKQRKAEIREDVLDLLYLRRHKLNSVIRATNRAERKIYGEELVNNYPITAQEQQINSLLERRHELLEDAAQGFVDNQNRADNANISTSIHDLEVQIPVRPTKAQKKESRKMDKIFQRLDGLRRYDQGFITGFQEYSPVVNNNQPEQYR